MMTRLSHFAVGIAAAALVSGAAAAADAQQTERPSHRTRPAMSAPVSPEQQEAVKKANAEYKAARQQARADYRKAIADARAKRDQALANSGAAGKK